MADVFLPYYQFLLRKSVIKDVQADKRRKNSKQLKIWDAWIKQSLKKWTFLTFFTRKYPLRGYCLAPSGRRQRITLKREKILGAGGITDNVITDGQTDVEIEIVF